MEIKVNDRSPIFKGESTDYALSIHPNYAKISRLHFFSNPSEKIGRNFFAFELASEIAVSLSPAVKKALLKLGYTPDRLNQSCMEIGYGPVEKAFPRINDKTLSALLNDVAKAWGNMLAAPAQRRA